MHTVKTDCERKRYHFVAIQLDRTNYIMPSKQQLASVFRSVLVKEGHSKRQKKGGKHED
jgi:hypothetical protein